MIAVWAVWQAGAAFLPLDPELPAARLAMMLDDAAPAVVVSQGTVPGSWPTVSPDTDLAVPDVALPRVGAHDLACVMFTSGSTGRPKGVMLEHGGLAMFATRQLLPRLRASGVGEHARVVTGSSAFISDFFLEQVLSLLDGHRLLVLSGRDERDPRHLVELAQDPARAVDVVCTTSSQVQLMVEAGLLDAPYPPRLIEPAGEACPPDLLLALTNRPGIVANNVYGPAETTVDATYAVMKAANAHLSPVIGRPYGNVRAYLVDAGLDLVPPGAVGEIVIGGPGVGRGYLRRPDVTAAAFLPDPWGAPGSRLYRTGDLGRYTEDGQIEILGRNDHQVKILGQRIEPQEVEAALRGHSSVEAAAVGAHRMGVDRRLHLVAHLVLAEDATLDRDVLRGYLAGRLPAAAVPTVFVPVAALPMTVGGKLDRAALTVPDEPAAQLPVQDVVAPRTETERLIAPIWETVLGVAPIGVHDDFFAVGGHSLLAIRLAMRVSAELGADLALHDVFAHSTVAAQAELIDQRAAAGPAVRSPRVERGAPGDLPASHAQERQWFLWQLAPDSPTYNVPWGYEVTGELDTSVLSASVDALVERHEALRTTLRVDADGQVVQRVGAAYRGVLSTEDVTEAQLPGLVEQEAARPFDLSAGPVLRVNVWRTAPDRHTILFVAHHVAVDEWSLEVLERELWTLYRAAGDAEAAALPALEVSYADYAVWHRDLVARQAEDDLAHWRRALDGAPASWPHPHGTRADVAPTAGECDGFVPSARLARLDEVRAKAGATEFTVFLAVYSLLLARSSGERDFTVGVPVSGRSHPDFGPLVGFFVNTLALRVTVRPEDDFLTHLKRVQSVVLAAFAHQEAPFEHVVRAVAPDRGDGASPLFRTMFSFTAGAHQADRLANGTPAGLTVRDLPMQGGGNHFDLSLSTTRTAEGLHLTLDFATDLFAAGAAEGLMASFTDLLHTIDGSPTIAVAELLRAGQREQEQVSGWTGDAGVPPCDVPVHELLRERTTWWPDVVAVESTDDSMTFAELGTRGDALARRLVAAGVRRGDVVGLHLRPGVDAIVAVLAVWRAGGAFLPLDPDLPSARLAMMLDDAQPTVVVSLEDVPGSWPTLSPADEGPVPDVALPQVGARDLAYVMFTSGSTGRPKGVMVEHGNLANYAERLLLPRMRGAGIGEHATVLTGSSAFISDFFLAQMLSLLDGHRLLVLTGVEGRDPRHLVELAQDPARSVDLVDMTTSQIQLMVAAGLLDAPYPPRLIVAGGEACPPDLWDALRCRPGVVAHNSYGPAEATVDVAFADMGAHASPVIGRPLANARVYLVDEDLCLVPPGAIGEIVIGGPGVGRGYVRRPDVTAAAFVPDPWGEPGSRLYRTGDLGRYTDEGQIEFLGRDDHQVKIQGQRVEPEDVEAALRSHPSVVAAAVSAHRLGPDQRLHLVGHVVLGQGATLDREGIGRHLADRLPAAAVPTVLATIDALPTTVGGKLDRAALTVPEEVAAGLSDRTMVAPRTPTERRIAEAWQAALGVAEVGVHDDFFALGGHSLLAIRLTMDLSREFGTEIPLAHLYTAPTVAEQAARLAALVDQRRSVDDRSVVPLGGTRGARPLVLVHPIGGMLFSYLDLLGEVRADFEVFGVQGAVGGSDTGATDIGGLARRYADELVPALDGRAPVIAGWSAGGVLAHELARTLADRGSKVHRLLLVDSDPLPADETAEYRQDIAVLDALRREVAEHGPEPLLRSGAADRLFATLGVDPAAVAELDGATAAALMAFWRDMFVGLAAHRPALFAGHAELVLARGERGDPTAEQAIAAAWRDLTATLTVSYADGDHFQLLRRPWVKAVADALLGSIAQTGD